MPRDRASPCSTIRRYYIFRRLKSALEVSCHLPTSCFVALGDRSKLLTIHVESCLIIVSATSKVSVVKENSRLISSYVKSLPLKSLPQSAFNRFVKNGNLKRTNEMKPTTVALATTPPPSLSPTPLVLPPLMLALSLLISNLFKLNLNFALRFVPKNSLYPKIGYVLAFYVVCSDAYLSSRFYFVYVEILHFMQFILVNGSSSRAFCAGN